MATEEELRRKAWEFLKQFDERLRRKTPAQREMYWGIYKMLGEIEDREEFLRGRRPRRGRGALPARWER